MDGQCAVPERPLLPPWLRLARVGDRLLLEHGDAVVSLEGKAATLLLPRLLPLLDGSRTAEDVANELGGEMGDAAAPAIATLARHGYVVEGPAASDEDALVAASVGRGSTTLAEAQCRLECARVAVVGSGAAAEELRRLLSPALGSGAVAGWDDGAVDADLVVVAPQPSELPQLALWNERMLDLRVPWLQVLPFNGRAAFLGPLFVPPETGCHACFELRRAEALGEVADFAAVQCVPARYPVGRALAAATAGLAASLALRWLATADPALPAALFALELRDGLAITRHRLLRVPRCHACSGTRRLPPPLPWAEAVER
jgi:bacteriocin biosynthesis cyclodehydratase domain-containing protein